MKKTPTWVRSFSRYFHMPSEFTVPFLFSSKGVYLRHLLSQRRPPYPMPVTLL